MNKHKISRKAEAINRTIRARARFFRAKEKHFVNRAGRAYGTMISTFFGWKHPGSAIVAASIRDVTRG